MALNSNDTADVKMVGVIGDLSQIQPSFVVKGLKHKHQS